MGISREQALDCFRSDDLVGIGMEADAVRRRLHPEGVASYVVERRIGYADFAGLGEDAACDAICAQVGGALELGATGVLLHGSAAAYGPGDFASSRMLGWFEQLLSAIRQRYPSIWLTGLSAPELLAIVRCSEMSLQDSLQRLREAGLDSIRGEGADVTGQSVRRGQGNSCSIADWLAVHRAAHSLGMRTTAAMVFGTDCSSTLENYSEQTLGPRVDFLQAVRNLQEETGGFTAFVPLSFQPREFSPGARDLDAPTAVECLKTLAISRMFLDNIENVQSNWAVEGLKVRQMGLRFGGNDVGSATCEEATAKSGQTQGSSEEDLRRIIRDVGFMPVQRDPLYRTMFLN
jgi:cyclic dehypoxanthinyl futalosine synthase